MKDKKIFIAWFSLIILIILILALNYLKFFGSTYNGVTEIPIENSSTTAITNALTEITNQFNQNEKIEKYKEENININALLNQYSIFIQYSKDNKTTTYEFNYSNLKLNIHVEDQKENMEKFQTIYKILIESCQKRIGNTNDLDKKIEDILNENDSWNGIIKSKEDNIIHYQLDITKKI